MPASHLPSLLQYPPQTGRATPHGVNGGEQHWIVKTSQPDQPPAITISRPSGFGDGKSAWLVLRCIESEASVLIAAPLPMSGSGPISVSYRLSNGIQKTEEWISTSNGVFFAPSGDSRRGAASRNGKKLKFRVSTAQPKCCGVRSRWTRRTAPPSFWAECAKVPNRATEEYSDPDSQQNDVSGVKPTFVSIGAQDGARQVQQRLIDLGYLSGTADGVWGARSQAALKNFCAKNGLDDVGSWNQTTSDVLLGAAALANVNAKKRDGPVTSSGPFVPQGLLVVRAF